MAKRKQNGELVIKIVPLSSSSVEVEIHGLLEKISDDEKKKKPIQFKFNLGDDDVERSIRVYPDYRSSGFIGVFLDNSSSQDQRLGPAPVTALSHGGFKKWVEENGDVFKLEVSMAMSVTLLSKDKVATEGWTRYYTCSVPPLYDF